MIKKLLLVVSAFVTLSAHAELTELDDEALSEIEGKGIVIDIEYQMSIAEIAFRDAGSLVVQGIRIGGNSNEDK